MHTHKSHILFISHSGGLYGAERSLLALLGDLNRKRFYPIVVLPYKGPLQECIENLSIPVEIVPSLTAWLTRRRGIQKLLHNIAVIPFILRSVWELLKIIRQHKICIIHTNSLVMIDGAIAARLMKLPHVWHAREILDDQSPHNFILGPCAALSIISRLSHRIIAISKVVENSFHQCKRTPKIRVIYNPSDLHQSSDLSHTNDFRLELNISDDVPLVTQIANVTPVKGCEDFVQAAVHVRRSIPDARFLLVGGTPYPDYQRGITNLIEYHDMQNHFILTGFRQDVLDIYRAIDLLVLPSHYEPFGRVLIEAMAAGKPVIGTRVGGIPEIIEDGVTGLLVPPHSPEKLAQAIIEILQNREMAHQMGEAGRIRAQELFSVERYVAEIEKIYEELLTEK